MKSRKPLKLEDIDDFDCLMEKAKWYRKEWARAMNNSIALRKKLIALRAVLDDEVKVESRGDRESVINLCNHYHKLNHI
jgi:hypothetical protein